MIIRGDATRIPLPDCSVDAVVTDPPYGLEFMGKEWDRFAPMSKRGARGWDGRRRDDRSEKWAGTVNDRGDGKPGGPTFSVAAHYSPVRRCAKCSGWEFGNVVRGKGGMKCQCVEPEFIYRVRHEAPTQRLAFQNWCEEWAAEALRVLKPGGHLLAFGGTRTYHRMTCAIEDAGFEVRDCLAWLYGSGFPKGSRVNRDPRFCQCGVAERSEWSTSPELEPDGHMDTAVGEVDGVPPLGGAPRSTRRAEGSLAGCPPGHGSDGGPARLVLADDQATPPSPPRVRGRSRSAELGDGPADGAGRSPSQAPRTAPPSSLGSPVLADGLASLGPDMPAGSTPVDQTGSGIAPPSSRTSHTVDPLAAWSHCRGCGKPNADGWNVSLKPAHEPIVLARKPLTGTVAQNVLRWGTGALNVDGCRVGMSDEDLEEMSGRSGARTAGTLYPSKGDGQSWEPTSAGRWPPNVAMDEEAARLLDEQSGPTSYNPPAMWRTDGPGVDGTRAFGKGVGKRDAETVRGGYGDTGGASRFFYVAKASRAERNAGLEGMPKRDAPWLHDDGRAQPRPLSDPRMDREQKRLPTANHHPTVKPLALMRWLVRLVTPPGGIVLDPFLGSGTTLLACAYEGMRGIGIEREAEYVEIAKGRLSQPIQAGML